MARTAPIMNLKPDMNFLFSFRPGSWGLSEGYIDQKEAGLKSNLAPLILGRPSAVVGVDKKDLYAPSPGHRDLRFALLHYIGLCFSWRRVVN